MISLLPILLRIAGGGLILLALLHIPIGRKLRWSEDSRNLTPVNAAVFQVHTFFICLVLGLMGLPCLMEPAVFLTPTRAGTWVSWSFATFWAIRLYCQWFVYAPGLWQSKRLETLVHTGFTLMWTALTALFSACGAVQMGWIR